ncbi:MAG TPA: TetR/AcrR family transcriptional regulator [Verrucomicrobiae bacterium]|nr:TetR/AcrR family transcriptional regulator [Verrucomicrobiae bacterium]
MNCIETKTRILDVAEELFADNGFERVSIRDITEKAKVNLAAVNYHFGTKDELIAAVFERRIGPVNHARLEALSALEKSTGGRRVKVEEILEAVIRPTLTGCAKEGRHLTTFTRLMGRCLVETTHGLEELLKRQFDPLIRRMDALLLKALPHLSRAEIFWRRKFTFGVLHHWLLTRDRFVPADAGKVDTETQIQMLIAFVTAGFRTA